MASRPPGLLGLSDDTLTLILSLLDQDSKSQVLPLVCRRFHRVLNQPDVWPELAFTDWRRPLDLQAPPGPPLPPPPLAAFARLRSFMLWAPRVACGLRRLKFDIPTALGEDDDIPLVSEAMAGLVGLLAGAAPKLQMLELRGWWGLPVGRVLPPTLQRQLTALTELHLLAGESVYGVQLDGLRSLCKLNIVVDDDGDILEWLDEHSTLPPSLTWLGLTPAPREELPDGGVFQRTIPPCVCALPQLKFLDVSESQGLTGLEDALSQLTLLTGLALDHAGIDQLPRAVTRLQHLRLLSLHGAFSLTQQDDAGPVDLTPLASLKQLRVLSVSECHRLPALPPAVVGLTRLRALHLEKCPLLARLPDNLLLPHLVMLSIDWGVLFSSHAVVARQPQLQQLLLGSTYGTSVETPAFELAVGPPAVAPPADLPAIEASLQRCPALATLSVIVYPGPYSCLTTDVAALMLRLPRACPRLQLQPLHCYSFFLTDSEQLAEGD